MQIADCGIFSSEFLFVTPELRTNQSELLSFAKVMEHYPFYYIPLTLPSPPTTGERIKVKGSNVMAIFVPLFT